ncbi:MAG: LysM domain-containing protein [Caldilineaceae bacterium]
MPNAVFEWFFSAIYIIIAFAIVYLYFFKIVPMVLSSVKAWNIGDIIRITVVLGGIAILMGCLTVITGDWIFSQVLDSLPRTRMAREINEISGGFRFPVSNNPLVSSTWSLWGSAKGEESTDETGTGTNPIPVVQGTLKSNAIDLWAAALQSIYNPTGNINDNAKVMNRRDIPVNVVCDVYSDNNWRSWLPQRQESWQLSCSDNNFKSQVFIEVNGTAARGLTGGGYYTQNNPFTVYGSGLWPDIAYQTPPVYTAPTPVPGTGGPTTGSAGTHKVLPGESLGAIADKYGIKVSALVAANTEKYPQLKANPNIISPGWELIIPSK